MRISDWSSDVCSSDLRLLDALGTPDLLIEAGHFIAWESADTAARGRAAWMQAAIGTARVRDASADELATIRALVARPIAGAIRFEGSGHIADPDTLSDVLEQGLLRQIGRAHV